MSSYVETAKTILTTLKDNGYDAYFVGGFVRDFILGQTSDDIDITTSATPEEVESLFPYVKQTGKKFGGVTIIEKDHRYEVTTFRKEGAYKQHRYPAHVTFSTDVKDDVIRRDFTINGLLMNENEDIIDYVHGQVDLKKKIIQTIGNPIQRFEEDALRILRTFRFVSKLGFDIEQDTLDAITKHRDLIHSVKIERVMIELNKMLQGPFQKKALEYMIKTGVHTVLFGLEKGIEYVVTLDETIQPLEFFMIAFILDDVSDVWRFSNRDIRLIYQVINLHEVTKEDEFNKFILFSNKLDACLITNRINVLMGYKDHAEQIKQMWDEMPVKDVCDLAFKGQHILEQTTLRQRSIIGLVIDDLLTNVLLGILPNEYEPLREFALKRVEELQTEMSENND
jgi:tRNA nucleotidyltransferase (CCA-adding enzyme)